MAWQSENKYDSTLKIGAFFLSPVLGLFASLLRINTRSSFVVLFAVFVTFGFSMVTTNERSEAFNFDTVAYRQWFEEAYEDTPHEFANRFDDYIHLQNHNMDFYCDLLNFLVSRFTNNYHFLFLFVALVYGFFKLKVLKLFVQEDNYHFSIVCFALLFIFLMNFVLGGLNVFRFHTALIIAVYALFQLLVNDEKKYLFLLAITPFFHGSFFVIYPLILLYYLVRNHLQIFTLIAAILVAPFILFPSFTAHAIQFVLSHIAPSTARFSLYTDMFYMANVNQGGAGFIWFQRILEHGSWMLIDVAVIFFALTFKTHIKNTKCEQLFRFLVVFTFFVNAVIFIPSFGSRFMMLTFPMIAYIYLVCYSTEKRFVVWAIAFAAFYLFCFFMPWCVYQIPCFKHYTMLWEPCFFMTSPLYLAVRYLILATV